MKTTDIERLISDLEDIKMEEQMEEALYYAEENVLYSAQRFLDGNQDWHEEHIVEKLCKGMQYDYDLVWLVNQVLFGSAVVYMKTGKTV